MSISLIDILYIVKKLLKKFIRFHDFSGIMGNLVNKNQIISIKLLIKLYLFYRSTEKTTHIIDKFIRINNS